MIFTFWSSVLTEFLTLDVFRTSAIEGHRNISKKIKVFINGYPFLTVNLTLCLRGKFTLPFVLGRYFGIILTFIFSFPFSRGSSQPRDQTWVSCIVGRFFTAWSTKEALFSFTLALSQQKILVSLSKLFQNVISSENFHHGHLC